MRADTPATPDTDPADAVGAVGAAPPVAGRAKPPLLRDGRAVDEDDDGPDAPVTFMRANSNRWTTLAGDRHRLVNAPADFAAAELARETTFVVFTAQSPRHDPRRVKHDSSQWTPDL